MKDEVKSNLKIVGQTGEPISSRTKEVMEEIKSRLDNTRDIIKIPALADNVIFFETFELDVVKLMLIRFSKNKNREEIQKDFIRINNAKVFNEAHTRKEVISFGHGAKNQLEDGIKIGSDYYTKGSNENFILDVKDNWRSSIHLAELFGEMTMPAIDEWVKENGRTVTAHEYVVVKAYNIVAEKLWE